VHHVNTLKPELVSSYKLDNLKIQILKDLCERHELNTSTCNVKEDYVKLLEKIGY
jgi:hypothetical protein